MSNGGNPNTPLAVLIAGGFLTGAAAIGTIAGAAWKGSDAAIATAVPIVGVVLFLGVAMLGHYTLPDPSVGAAAIRSGLAAGFVGAYLTVLGFSVFSEAHFSTSLVKHLTWVVGAVVTFYFGASTVSEKIQSNRESSGGTGSGTG